MYVCKKSGHNPYFITCCRETGARKSAFATAAIRSAQSVGLFSAAFQKEVGEHRSYYPTFHGQPTPELYDKCTAADCLCYSSAMYVLSHDGRCHGNYTHAANPADCQLAAVALQFEMAALPHAGLPQLNSCNDPHANFQESSKRPADCVCSAGYVATERDNLPCGNITKPEKRFCNSQEQCRFPASYRHQDAGTCRCTKRIWIDITAPDWDAHASCRLQSGKVVMLYGDDAHHGPVLCVLQSVAQLDL